MAHLWLSQASEHELRQNKGKLMLFVPEAFDD